MAVVNTEPIYSKVGDIQWSGIVTAANTAKDGTGTVNTVFTADATNGGFVRSVIMKSAGTCVQTVARLFINNGSTNATAANNTMIREITLPAITNSETAAQPDIEVPIGFALPPGYKINVALGTAVSAGWHFTGVGGKY
jgi:hypothetical protein